MRVSSRGYAWSISLNPGKHQKPDEKAVKVRVLPARFNAKSAAIEKSPQAVPLDYFLVSTEGFGIPNCIIFRPAGVIASPGAASLGRSDGREDPHGRRREGRVSRGLRCDRGVEGAISFQRSDY